MMTRLLHCLVATVLAVSPGSAAPKRADLLVTTDWLAAHLTDSNIRVVDMRMRGYDAGHIPWAFPLDNNAIRVADRPPMFLPTAREFEAVMDKLGVEDGTRVVVYDDRGGIYAARLWMV